MDRRTWLSSVTKGTVGVVGIARGWFGGSALAQPPALNKKGRVIILGFDGVEPRIVETMLTAGELPNLAKLRAAGQYQRLGTSTPPQSPSAWSTFATCSNPGNHGIFDFLRRSNKKYYIPGLGFSSLQHAKLSSDGTLVTPPEYEAYRKGTTFWRVADEHGARCKILLLPYAFPPEDLKNSKVLCGLETPDIRATQSTYFTLSDAVTEVENVPGGMRLPLVFTDGQATVEIPGARDTRQKYSSDEAFVKVPVQISVDREAGTAAIDVQGQRVSIKVGEATPWLAWQFSLSPSYAVHAISRIHARRIDSEVLFYMTCLQFDPRTPYAPMSTPSSYAKELVDRYGLYKTIGWAYDTKAMQKDDIDERMFLADVRDTMAWREQLTLDELDKDDFDLLLAGWTATDRAAHMFWRYRDPKHPLYTTEGNARYGRALEDVYKRMDEIVGKVMGKVKENDLLMVLSDHGFHSYRTGFAVNTWLVRNGYMTLKGQTDAGTASSDAPYLRDVDWSGTQAYGLGLSSVYLNLVGREGQGIVPAAEASKVRTELKEKLMAVTDPATGDKVFRSVQTCDEAYKGASMEDAPDLILGYSEGYQVAKPSASGAAPEQLFMPNDDKWSGEHAGSDPAITPGILFTNQPLKDGATLVDLGVTTLEYLGCAAPDDYEGRSLLVSEAG